MAQQTGSGGPVVGGFNELAKANAQTMEAFSKSYESVFEKVGRLNGEALDFWVKRMKADFELPAKIAHCHAPEEVAETCSQFVSKMFSDYNAQAGRIIDAMSDVAGEGFVLSQRDVADSNLEEPAQNDKPAKN